MSAPFFSVIIPTRNRLDMLKLSLSSLVKQDFKDFEIIISDNSDAVGQCLNFAYIKTLGLSNLIYKKPDIILTMHDHWEFALNGAKGLYQGVLIDKTLLRNKALSALFQILTNDHEIDILNYLQIGIEYHPKRLFKYKIQSKIVDDFSQAIDYFSPKVEISKKFNFSKNIFSDKSSYVLGKICFGFYKKDLISKVISRYVRIFHPFSPDYTSCILALSQANKVAIYNKTLLYSVNNFSGNGRLSITKKGHTLEFVRNIDPSLSMLLNLPIPNLYSSIHNFSAYDYSLLNRLSIGNYEINIKNLIAKCKKDFSYFNFDSFNEREEQWKILVHYAKKNNVKLTKKPIFFKKYFILKLIRLLNKEISYKEKLDLIIRRIFGVKTSSLDKLLN